MKTSLTLGSALALLLVSGVSSAAVTTYKATLNGTQETPAVVTAATGTATLTFDDASKLLTGTVTYQGVTATAAHIHAAACGVSGSVAKPLNTTVPGTITVNETLTDAQATSLVAGDLYVNIHSAANGSGEIRGQLYLDGSGKTCPAVTDGGTEGGIVDSGADTGTPGSSGSSGTSGSSGSSGSSGTSGSSGSNGATTTPVDAGTSTDSGSSDDGGCSSTGSNSTSNGLAIAGLAGLGLAIIMRSRKKR